MVLGVPLNLSLVGVHKNLGVTKALAEKRLELISHNRNKSVCVMSPLVLLPTEADPVSEKRRGKKNLGKPRSSSNSKIVLTLLTEVIAVHVRIPAIYIRRTGLQLLAGCFDNDGSRNGSGSRNRSRSKNGSRSGDSGLKNSLKNLLQVILRVLVDTSNNSGSVSNKSFCRGSSGLG